MLNQPKQFLGIKNNKMRINFSGFLLAVFIFLFLIVMVAPTQVTASNTATWSFSSGTDYTYDSTNITFRNQRADLVPTGLQLDWAKTWTELGENGGWRIATDQSGDIYIKGHYGTNPTYLYVAKFTPSMQKIWEYTDSPGVQYSYYDYGRIYIDSNNNSLTGGALKDINTGQWYWYTLMLDSNGHKIWDKITIMSGVTTAAGYSLNTPGDIEYGANAFGEDSSGNIYSMGLSGITINTLRWNSHLRVIKYDSSGNVIWDKSSEQEWTYGTEPDDINVPKRQISGGGAWDGKVDSAGNVYTTGPGILLPWSGRGEDWVTTKIDSNGNMLWARAWSYSSGSTMDRPEALVLDDQDNVLIDGYGNARPITVMYDNSGNQIWARNAYNTDNTLTSTNNGYLLAASLDYMGYFIGYGDGTDGLLVWYDSQANRKYFASDIVFPNGVKEGWNVATTDGYIYLIPTKPEASAGIIRYKYTYPSPLQAVIALADPNKAVAYDKLNSFSDEIAGDGQIKYQLSNNGTDWYYWNGSIWTKGNDDVAQANLSSEINSHLTDFNAQVGNGEFYFRVYMIPGSPVALKSVTLTHDDQPASLSSLSPTITILPQTGENSQFWIFAEWQKIWEKITTAINIE